MSTVLTRLYFFNLLRILCPNTTGVFMTQAVKQPSFPDSLSLAFLLPLGGCGGREEIYSLSMIFSFSKHILPQVEAWQDGKCYGRQVIASTAFSNFLKLSPKWIVPFRGNTRSVKQLFMKTIDLRSVPHVGFPLNSVNNLVQEIGLFEKLSEINCTCKQIVLFSTFHE